MFPRVMEVIEDSDESNNGARITIHSQVCGSLTQSISAVEKLRSPIPKSRNRLFETIA